MSEQQTAGALTPATRLPVVGEHLSPDCDRLPPHIRCVKTDGISVYEGHASDCAVHNEPAYPNGPCDCQPTSGAA